MGAVVRPRKSVTQSVGANQNFLVSRTGLIGTKTQAPATRPGRSPSSNRTAVARAVPSKPCRATQRIGSRSATSHGCVCCCFESGALMSFQHADLGSLAASQTGAVLSSDTVTESGVQLKYAKYLQSRIPARGVAYGTTDIFSSSSASQGYGNVHGCSYCRQSLATRESRSGLPK
jgi:hypothetical protein